MQEEEEISSFNSSHEVIGAAFLKNYFAINT